MRCDCQNGPRQKVGAEVKADKRFPVPRHLFEMKAGRGQACIMCRATDEGPAMEHQEYLAIEILSHHA